MSLFGLVFAYLAAAHPELLFGSAFLFAVGFAMLVGLVVLAKHYWFSIPLAGVSVSLVCYAASIVLWESRRLDHDAAQVSRQWVRE